MAVKTHTEEPSARKADLKFGTEFGAIAGGVSDRKPQGWVRRLRENKCVQAADGVGAILVLFLRSVCFQCLRAVTQLRWGWWSGACLHAVTESSMASQPRLLSHSNCMYSAPLGAK